MTPFLLDHIYRASGGASLEANVSAVRNNVAVAGADRPGLRRARGVSRPLAVVVGDVINDIVVRPLGPMAVGHGHPFARRGAAGRIRRQPGGLAGGPRRRASVSWGGPAGRTPPCTGPPSSATASRR